MAVGVEDQDEARISTPSRAPTTVELDRQKIIEASAAGGGVSERAGAGAEALALHDEQERHAHLPALVDDTAGPTPTTEPATNSPAIGHRGSPNNPTKEMPQIASPEKLVQLSDNIELPSARLKEREAQKIDSYLPAPTQDHGSRIRELSPSAISRQPMPAYEVCNSEHRYGELATADGEGSCVNTRLSAEVDPVEVGEMKKIKSERTENSGRKHDKDKVQNQADEQEDVEDVGLRSPSSTVTNSTHLSTTPPPGSGSDEEKRDSDGGVWSDDEAASVVPVVESPWSSMLTDLLNLDEKTDTRDVSDFEHFQGFFREWLEEKQLFAAGKIESRPLQRLIELMSMEAIDQDDTLRESLKELDNVLTRRCRSLDIVRQRDVRAKEKTWVCEPCLYLPPRSQWIHADENEAAWNLLDMVRNGTPQEIHMAVQRCGSMDIALIRDKRGRCVMHFAAQKGNVAALEYFGPLANALDSEGYAPLHYAAYFGHRITCDRLIQLGADVDLICGPNGRTAFDYAEDGLMKCTMISLALNGADSPKARALAQRYIESLSGSYRKKWAAAQYQTAPTAHVAAPMSFTHSGSAAEAQKTQCASAPAKGASSGLRPDEERDPGGAEKVSGSHLLGRDGNAVASAAAPEAAGTTASIDKASAGYEQSGSVKCG